MFEKQIDIQPRFPHRRNVYISDNMADYCEFITIPSVESGTAITVRHTVPQEKILEAKLQKGEKYRIELSNKCLGTIWWMFGPDPRGGREGVKLKEWIDREDDPEEWAEAIENDDENVFRGERYQDLALVDETEEATFEVV